MWGEEVKTLASFYLPPMVVYFSYYRLKVSKVKVWRVVLEAAGLLLIEYLLMVLVGLALAYYGLIPLA